MVATRTRCGNQMETASIWPGWRRGVTFKILNGSLPGRPQTTPLALASGSRDRREQLVPVTGQVAPVHHQRGTATRD
jgi:hypothetical protein